MLNSYFSADMTQRFLEIRNQMGAVIEVSRISTVSSLAEIMRRGLAPCDVNKKDKDGKVDLEVWSRDLGSMNMIADLPT